MKKINRMEFMDESKIDQDVTSFLQKAIDMEDATAFIGFILDKDDKASTIICANPMHIMGFIQELYTVLGEIMGPTENDTIQ